MRVILRTHVAAILVALIAAVLLVPPAGAATSRATATISLSRTSVISGESVRVSGGLSTRVARPTYLQRHNGTSWRTIQRKKSTSRGRYAFSVRQTGAVGTKRAYRVVAPRIRINGRSYASVASSGRRATVVAQTAVLAAPERVTVAKTFTVTATLRPVRAGRVSVLQKLSGGTWTEVKRGKQSSVGKTSFSVTESGVATVSLRVVAAASGGASAKASAPVTVKVLPPALQRASESSTGTDADGGSRFPVVDGTGRYAAFVSEATNLVPGDTNGLSDVFVRDLETQAVERVSRKTNGEQSAASSEAVSISADGRYVAFNASGSSLDGGTLCASSGCVYRYDRVTGVTEVVSVAISGHPNSSSYHPSISGDGTKVAFASNASNLVAGDTNAKADVFIRDLVAGTTVRISVDSDGVEANGASTFPKISADGDYVAYESAATNLVPGDTEGQVDVFLWSELSHSVVRVSQGPENDGGESRSSGASISADGRYVTYRSESSNLVASDTNNYDDVFRWDRTSFENTLVSLTNAGNQIFADFWSPTVSGDGRHVTFASRGFPVAAGETSGTFDVFVRDIVAGTTRRISQNLSSGSNGNDSSMTPSISGNGTVVVFSSSATNLVSSDTNAVNDIYARDLTR